MTAIWHVLFKGRGLSGHATQNFLWQDGPVYIMDNHRAAWWCWLRHFATGEVIDIFHIDRHTDTLRANLAPWLAALPTQMRGIPIQTYLNYQSTVNGIPGAANLAERARRGINAAFAPGRSSRRRNRE